MHCVVRNFTCGHKVYKTLTIISPNQCDYDAFNSYALICHRSMCVCVWSTTACINLHVVSDSIFPLFHRFRSVTAILICWFVFDSHGWWLPVFRSSFSWASLLLKLDSLVQSNRKFLQTCKTKIKTKTTHTCGRTLLAFCRFFRAAHVWTNFV